ncbi:phosphotransferase family protein [Sorangium cellulosum]|uniref:phosphotransferase family protein n=1 Tax=Sorangium cellulosum TaxID=56 RepID=UPI0009D77ACC|nr:phosphotransferase [Sorangium cellulosum]
MRLLPNPERAWERAAHVEPLDRAGIERRVGPFPGEAEVLSGGRANVNVRLGAERVLRVYRRDPGAAPKEARLLARGWRSFRVPAVLSAGEDFLVLEYVPHGPLQDTAACGAAAGRALAEIHAVGFDSAGFLGPELAVTWPFDDCIGAFRAHVDAVLDRLAPAVRGALGERVGAFLDANAGALRALASVPVLLHGDFKASNLHWLASGELLVLDWEFAYAGPSLMDVGQLLRWSPGPEFVAAFVDAYRASAPLPDGFERWAAAFDLFNLVGLLEGAEPGSRRASDVLGRILATIEDDPFVTATDATDATESKRIVPGGLSSS